MICTAADCELEAKWSLMWSCGLVASLCMIHDAAARTTAANARFRMMCSGEHDDGTSSHEPIDHVELILRSLVVEP